MIVTNTIGALSGPNSRLLRSLVRTYRSVFPTVAAHPVFENFDDGKDPTQVRNLILVAGESALPGKGFLQSRWEDVRRDVPTAPDLTRAIRDRWAPTIPTGDVPLLTDDYAPTDALLLLLG